MNMNLRKSCYVISTCFIEMCGKREAKMFMFHQVSFPHDQFDPNCKNPQMSRSVCTFRVHMYSVSKILHVHL